MDTTTVHHHGEAFATDTAYTVQELRGEDWADFLIPFPTMALAHEAARRFKQGNPNSTVRIIQVCEVWL